jgi:hypothetical protein
VKKHLTRLEAAIADKQFPIYLLAAVGVLAMPHSWSALVIGLIAVSATYSYLKRNPGTLKDPAVWKRPEIQRGGVIAVAGFWFWLISSAYQANLISPFDLDYLPLFLLVCSPLLVYLGTTFHIIAGRPKNTKANDQHALNKWQLWVNSSIVGYVAAFVFSTITAICMPGGTGSQLSQWLISSALDANLSIGKFIVPEIELKGTMEHTHVVYHQPDADAFTSFVGLALSAVIVGYLWPRAMRLACFLTSWLKKMGGTITLDFYQAFLTTLRAPRTRLILREPGSFSKNVAQSFLWLLACWAALFGLFGFTGGPLGESISGWLHVDRAGLAYNEHIRIFLASFVALYATVPVAVMTSMVLPYRRRRQVILSSDGVFFPDGPYTAVGFKPLRLWSDFASVDITSGASPNDYKKRKLVFKFHTGSQIVLKLAQLSQDDLVKLLSALDEYSTNCRVCDELVNLHAQLRNKSEGMSNKSELGVRSAQQFQSTVFVPHTAGSWLPGGEMRVVRLLAARPLSAVYLVRSESGKPAIAKQFFLAEENEQTDALRKCLEREYELLRKLDHPALSKVLDVYHRDHSTYLLIEHANGTDFRSLVNSHGSLDEDKVIAWALQLCDIMSYLHAQDPPIIHRDLTPDNIVLSEDGSLKLIDFGAAHQFLEGITGTVIGKQCYVSPEQLRGKAEPVSDIYSFGCMLHFLLTGEEPRALVQCNPSSKADVTPYMNDVVASCTEFEASKRPQSFEEVKKLLLSVREKPVQEVIAKLKEVAECQGIPIKSSLPEHIETNQTIGKPDGSIIKINDLQEQSEPR